ncbi:MULTISPECIES: hypothetical protein [unclassified Pseudomonas]|uniref:hypothetical protein n=1 Tax=unclassified Pseudomonas TaxID=196821 RepID=UPI001F57F9F3|nr:MULTISPECIES: hypothetical protein [unclassified Pseudomonas]
MQKRIQAACKDATEFALERVLAALTVKTPAGGFAGDANEDDPSITRFPTAQFKGVITNEWRALTASQITDAVETGLSSYALRDLDGDGQRDLIVNTYCRGAPVCSPIWKPGVATENGSSNDLLSPKVRCSTPTIAALISQWTG